MRAKHTNADGSHNKRGVISVFFFIGTHRKRAVQFSYMALGYVTLCTLPALSRRHRIRSFAGVNTSIDLSQSCNYCNSGKVRVVAFARFACYRSLDQRFVLDSRVNRVGGEHQLLLLLLLLLLFTEIDSVVFQQVECNAHHAVNKSGSGC